MRATNLTDGPKVLNASPQVIVAAGQSVDCPAISDVEVAELVGWFSIESPTASTPAADETPTDPAPDGAAPTDTPAADEVPAKPSKAGKA